MCTLRDLQTMLCLCPLSLKVNIVLMEAVH